MPEFENKGSQLYFEEEGRGDAVLVLPGWGGSIEEFMPLRKALAANYRVIAADLPGSGNSGPQPREYTAGYYEEDAAAFIALLDHLGVESAHVMGFSDGGEDALLMAILEPERVRSVAAWGASGRLVEPPGMLDAFYNLIDSPIPPLAGFAEYMKGAYGETNARAMTQSESRALRAIIASGGDISFGRAAEISCPVLLITGEHDFLCPPALAAETAQRIPGAEFIEAKDAGHDVHHARPEWLTETIESWLKKHSGVRAPA